MARLCELRQSSFQAHIMHFGVFVRPQTDMQPRGLLIEVCRREVEDLAPRGRQRMHIAAEGGFKERVDEPTRGSLEPLWSQNASRRIRAREKSHSIAYQAKVHLVERLAERLMLDDAGMPMASILSHKRAPGIAARLTRLNIRDVNKPPS